MPAFALCRLSLRKSRHSWERIRAPQEPSPDVFGTLFVELSKHRFFGGSKPCRRARQMPEPARAAATAAARAPARPDVALACAGNSLVGADNDPSAAVKG